MGYAGSAPALPFAPGAAVKAFFQPCGDRGTLFGRQCRELTRQRPFGALGTFATPLPRALQRGGKGVVIERFGTKKLGQSR